MSTLSNLRFEENNQKKIKNQSFVYLEPRLEKLLAKYNQNVNISTGDQLITLAKIDVDKFSDLCLRYKIEAVPTGRKKRIVFNN